ncbi:hypothetical protein HDU67_004547 [Dinochytrium kinnereticum]|nr:hypothetical protein HDU67_004547 [Dinochytrium kinnereticum]
MPRSSLAILDFLLPGYLLDQTESLMFPMPWHIHLNYIWFLQALIVLVWAGRMGRWVPVAGGSFKAWPAKQFWGLLVVHSGFYLVELYVTEMWTGYTPMAIHHTLALVIFWSVYREPNSLSVTCLTPFVVHAFYWSLGAEMDPLLYLYNWLLLICGVVGLHNYFVQTDPMERPIGPILPLSVILVCWTNYFTYCYAYQGKVCWKPWTYETKKSVLGPVFMSGVNAGMDVNFETESPSSRRWEMLKRFVGRWTPKTGQTAFFVSSSFGFVMTLLVCWLVAVRISRPLLERWRKDRWVRSRKVSVGAKGHVYEGSGDNEAMIELGRWEEKEGEEDVRGWGHVSSSSLLQHGERGRGRTRIASGGGGRPLLSGSVAGAPLSPPLSPSLSTGSRESGESGRMYPRLSPRGLPGFFEVNGESGSHRD